jgi:hypothetical protein
LGVRCVLRLFSNCVLRLQDWLEWLAVGLTGVDWRDEPVTALG